MKKVTSSRRARQRGNAIIEFALSATLLITLVAGIVGFSRIFNLANTSMGAAEAGVQYGALSPAHSGDLVGMQNAALADTGNYAGATATATQYCTCSVGGSQVSCSPNPCGSSTILKYAQVSVTLPYQTMINYWMIPNPVNVTQTAVGRVQ